MIEKSTLPFVSRLLDQALIDKIVEAERKLPKVSEMDPNRPGAWVVPDVLKNNPNFIDAKKNWWYRRYAWGRYYEDMHWPRMRRLEEMRLAGETVPDVDGSGASVPDREYVIAYARCYLQRRELLPAFETTRRWRETNHRLDYGPENKALAMQRLGDELGVKNFGRNKDMSGAYNRYFQLKYTPEATGQAYGIAWEAMCSGMFPDQGNENDFLTWIWKYKAARFQ